MRDQIKWSLILAPIALSACVTVKTAPQRGAEMIEARAVLPVPAKRKNSDTSGVLLSYRFEGVEPAGGGAADQECRLRMVQVDTGQSVFVNLKVGGSVSFENLEAGRYQMSRLGCGLARVYEVDGVYPEGFVVQAGNVSYLGQLVFVFKSKKLSEVQKAPRSVSAQVFESALAAVPPGAQVVSAFTAQPISENVARAAANEPRDDFEIRGKGIARAESVLEPLLEKLKSCDRLAAKADSLRFGRLDYLARYEGGSFKEIAERQDDHTFSENFRSCIELSLSAFRPSEKTPVEIRVVY